MGNQPTTIATHQQWVLKMMSDVAETARALKKAGLLKKPSQPFPPGHITAPLTELLVRYIQPSVTGTGNPFVQRTKSMFGVIAGSRLPTSTELLLAARIMHSSGNLMPVDVFKMALEIAGGDFEIAMLTVHNCLKEVDYAPKPPPPPRADMGFLELQINLNQRSDFEGQYGAEYAKIGFEVVQVRDRLYVGQKQISTALRDKLTTLRASDDQFGYDKMGPWYHMFGVLFTGAHLGPAIAQSLGGLEGILRHFQGYFSPEDRWKEFITNEGAMLGVDIVTQVFSDEGPLSIGGAWCCTDRGTYSISQHGDTMSWTAWSPMKLSGGYQWTNTFSGKITGTKVVGNFEDVPPGDDRNKGTLTLELKVVNNRATGIDLKEDTSGVYGGYYWWRFGKDH